MEWTETEGWGTVNVVLKIRFQKCAEFLDWGPVGFSSSTAEWHCINTTVHTVRRQKAIPSRTDSSAFLPVTGSAALFLHSTFCSLVRSVPSVNIPFSSRLCSSSQHSALQSPLFLQSKFCSPVRSVPSVNIPLSSPLCSSSQHSALQSPLFLQSTFRSPVRSVPSVNILLSNPLCSFSQHSTPQSPLFLQSTFRSPIRSVPSVNILLSSPLCSSSQNSPLQYALSRHIKPMALSVPRSYKHRPTSLHQIRSYFAGLPLRGPPFDPQSLHVWTVVQQQQYQLSAANRPQFCITFVCLCVSAVSSCWPTLQTVR